MYDLTSDWMQYYRELEPRRRRELFESTKASEPDDGANEYRKLLFDARHVNPKSPGKEVDRLLFMCVDYLQLCSSSKLFKGSAIREIHNTMREMRFDLAGQYGEAGEKALYWEIRNAAARYLSTCTAASYNRGVFGLMPSKDDNRTMRIVKDIWQMSEGLERRTGLHVEMALWTMAVKDQYFSAGEGNREMFEAYSEKMTKR